MAIGSYISDILTMCILGGILLWYVWAVIQYIQQPKNVPEICQVLQDTGKDYHDYHYPTGGDGTPSHFYTYTCWNCGHRFGI